MICWYLGMCRYYITNSSLLSLLLRTIVVDVSAKEKQARDNIKWEISLLKTKQVIPGEGKKIEKSVERAESERKLKILAILTICVGISYILARRRRI